MKRPAHDDSAHESCTIAPSRPIEPPEATVRSDEKLRSRLARTWIAPSPSATASMKSVGSRFSRMP